MGALPGGVGRGGRPETPQAPRGRVSPGLACSPVSPPWHPKMLLRPRRHSRSAPGTEPGPATRATAAAAPRRRRGAWAPRGLGPAVLLRPLAAQEAARLRGR